MSEIKKQNLIEFIVCAFTVLVIASVGAILAEAFINICA